MDNQQRWDRIGLEKMGQLGKPDEAVQFPDACASEQTFMKVLGSVKGKHVLELGCGGGEFSVYLSHKGATAVCGVDVGPNLIACACELARLRNINASFNCGDVARLTFADNTFDVICGIGILHHLSEEKLQKCLSEAYRVLSATGKAVFLEPIENSRTFDCIQNIFPARNIDTRYARPSILQRKKWIRYLQTLDDRPLAYKEISSAGMMAGFTCITYFPSGFLIRLERLFPRSKQVFLGIDRWLFKYLPFTRWFCQSALILLEKSNADKCKVSVCNVD